jgi:hypothetical protein
MGRANTPEERLAELADEVWEVLQQVVVEGRRGDWEAASRTMLALAQASRRVQHEIDFQTMNRWLDRAREAGDGVERRAAQ